MATSSNFLSRDLCRHLKFQSLLAQLIDEDYAQALGAGVLIPWDHLYELIRAKPYQSSLALLQLPALSPIVPSLRSTGTLTETSFEIGLSGWQNPNGSPAPLSALCGAMALANDGPYLLAQSVWRLVGLISEFASRSAADRTPENNRKQWGKIRRAALDANSVLDDFLFRSIVLTPDKLDIEFRKADIEGTTIVEIMPGFEGAPDRWLEYFDNVQAVPAHINIPTKDGVVHVALSSQCSPSSER